jgi:hypothetical protein
MKTAIGVCTMALFLSLLFANENTAFTDEELIHSCLRSAAKRLALELTELGFNEICILERVPKTGNENDAVFIEALSHEMVEMHAKIFFKKEDDVREKPTLFYRIVNQSVLIEEKEQLLSEPLYVREAKASISYRLLEPSSGEVLQASDITETLTDKISKSEYLDLKKGMKKSGVSFIRFLEPAIVTAIVAGLMYLFYAQKSTQ